MVAALPRRRARSSAVDEVSIVGRGVAEFGDGVVGGIVGHARIDLEDGRGEVLACKIRFSDPSAPPPDEWLTVGSRVAIGTKTWEITYISDPAEGSVVDLALRPG